MRFADQNSEPLEIEDNVNMTLIIIKMRYSTEPKHKKYVEGHSFLSFARKFGDICDKKLMDIAEKAASIRRVQKTAEATGDLIGNKVADKITSLCKTKSKEKEDERQQIIDYLRLF